MGTKKQVLHRRLLYLFLASSVQNTIDYFLKVRAHILSQSILTFLTSHKVFSLSFEGVQL